RAGTPGPPDPSYPPVPTHAGAGVTATASSERTEHNTPPRPSRRGDRAFEGVVRAAALTILIVLVAVFVFLAVEGWVGLTSDAAPPRRGRARAGCDALGDDPVRRVPLRPLRHGLGDHARPGPGARRDDGGGDGAGHHTYHDLERDRHREPSDDRGQHRPELQG